MHDNLNEVICIDDWLPDESGYPEGYYAEGARDKAVYYSPSDAREPLKRAWRYLFKQSRNRFPWQFWMEVMAYRIGRIVGVEVPPAYVGVRHEKGTEGATYGALIEWFYDDDVLYVDGARLIAPLIDGFDFKTGAQHNLQTILQIPQIVTVNESRARVWRKELLDWLAWILTFDTVIGNVDRHPMNWGLRMGRPSGGKSRFQWSPAFDNGTALSYELQGNKLELAMDEAWATNYLTKPRRAKHHMRWSLEALDYNFFEFMRKFADEYPETVPIIRSKLEFTEEDLRDDLEPLLDIPVPESVRLTKERLDPTVSLIMRRKALLLEALDRS